MKKLILVMMNIMTAFKLSSVEKFKLTIVMMNSYQGKLTQDCTHVFADKFKLTQLSLQGIVQDVTNLIQQSTSI